MIEIEASPGRNIQLGYEGEDRAAGIKCKDIKN